MEDAKILQAGHIHATENCIYGLSMHSLAGAAEDFLPLFLKASTLWQDHYQVPMDPRVVHSIQPGNETLKEYSFIHRKCNTSLT